MRVYGIRQADTRFCEVASRQQCSGSAALRAAQPPVDLPLYGSRLCNVWLNFCGQILVQLCLPSEGFYICENLWESVLLEENFSRTKAENQIIIIINFILNEMFQFLQRLYEFIMNLMWSRLWCIVLVYYIVMSSLSLGHLLFQKV